MSRWSNDTRTSPAQWQAMYEEALFHLLNTLHARHGGTAVCIAGGCGNNSVANGKVTLRTPFKEVTCNRPRAMPVARWRGLHGVA